MKQPFAILIASVAIPVRAQLTSTNLAAPRLDTSLVRLFALTPRIEATVNGTETTFAVHLYRCRVLDSNRFKRGAEIDLLYRHPQNLPQPQVGGTYLVSTSGTPGNVVFELAEPIVNNKEVVQDGDVWTLATSPDARAVWANFVLPLDRQTLAARDRTPGAMVKNLLASIQDMTYAQLSAYHDDLFALSRGFVEQLAGDTPFTAGLKQIAAGSGPEKSALLLKLRYGRQVLGADRDYGQALLRLSRLPQATWNAGDFLQPIEGYTAMAYRGPYTNRPLPPFTTEEAVAGLERTQSPELAGQFATFVRQPTSEQVSRLERAVVRKSPTVRAALLRRLEPSLRSKIGP